MSYLSFRYIHTYYTFLLPSSKSQPRNPCSPYYGILIPAQQRSDLPRVFLSKISKVQKNAILNGSGPGTYINLHSKTDIMHRLSAGIRHMQISSELLSNQTFLKGLNFAQSKLHWKMASCFFFGSEQRKIYKNVLKKIVKR